MRPVDVADCDHGDPDHRDQRNLDRREADRRSHQPAPSPACVAQPEHPPEKHDDDRQDDPPNDRIDRSPHQLIEDVRIRLIAEGGVAGERPEQKRPEHHPVEDEVAREGDDE